MNIFEALLPKDDKNRIEIPEELVERLKGPFAYIDVIDAFSNLLRQMESRIGEYQTIISDEASGRLPTLVFRKLIAKTRKDLGKTAPDTFFVVGGIMPPKGTREVVDDFLKEKIKEKGNFGKTLIVTEYVNTGISISKLMATLQTLGVDYDLATISSCYDCDSEQYMRFPQIKELVDKNGFFVGSENDPDDLFASRDAVGPGLKFNSNEGLGVDTAMFKVSPHPSKSPLFNRYNKFISEARESADLLADWLYRKVKNKR